MNDDKIKTFSNLQQISYEHLMQSKVKFAELITAFDMIQQLHVYFHNNGPLSMSSFFICALCSSLIECSRNEKSLSES